MQAQRRFALGLVSASQAPLQRRVVRLAKLVCWRFASAAPALRALPARALAPLSHMLMRRILRRCWWRPRRWMCSRDYTGGRERRSAMRSLCGSPCAIRGSSGTRRSLQRLLSPRCSRPLIWSRLRAGARLPDDVVIAPLGILLAIRLVPRPMATGWLRAWPTQSHPPRRLRLAGRSALTCRPWAHRAAAWPASRHFLLPCGAVSLRKSCLTETLVSTY